MDSISEGPPPPRPEPNVEQLSSGRWSAYHSHVTLTDEATREEAIAAYYAWQPSVPTPPRTWKPARKRQTQRTALFSTPAAHHPWYVVQDYAPNGARYDDGDGEWAPPINQHDDDYLLDLLGVPSDASRVLVKIHGASITNYMDKRQRAQRWHKYRVALIGIKTQLDDENRDWTNGHTSMVAYIRRIGWAGSPLYIESLGPAEPRQVSYRGFEERLPRPPTRKELDELDRGLALLRPITTGMAGRPKGRGKRFNSKADILALVAKHKRPDVPIGWTKLADLEGVSYKTLRTARRQYEVSDDVLG